MGPGGLLKGGAQGTRLAESKQDKYGGGRVIGYVTLGESNLIDMLLVILLCDLSIIMHCLEW